MPRDLGRLGTAVSRAVPEFYCQEFPHQPWNDPLKLDLLKLFGIRIRRSNVQTAFRRTHALHAR
jgi:hypothetical protein